MASRKDKYDNNLYENNNLKDSEEEIPTIDTRKARTVGSSTRGRPRYAKDVNISGLEYVHFGNTFVSYGVVNVEGGEEQERIPPRKPDNLMDLLRLDDGLPYNNVRRQPRRGNVNFTKTPITINTRPINMKVNSSKMKMYDEDKEKMKMYCMIGVYTVLALLILVLIFAVLFGFKNKSEQKGYVPNFNIKENIDPKKPLPRSYGVGNKGCDSKFYQNYIKKRRLRFVITKSLLYFCSHDSDQLKCYNEFAEEFALHKKNDFKDIYFNYIINSKGQFFHGRSPTDCPFDDSFLPKTSPEDDAINSHEDVITVGIGYCFDDESTGDYKKSQNEFDAIRQLIFYLQNTSPGHNNYGQLLENDFTLEFLEECKGSSLVNNVHGLGKIKYWKPNDETPQQLKNIIYYTDETQDTGNRNNHPFAERHYPEIPEYRITIIETDKSITGTCQEYFSGFSPPDYVVLVNGDYCRRKAGSASEEQLNYRIHLLSASGLKENVIIEKNMALIRSEEKWRSQEMFLKKIWKLSKEINLKTYYKPITAICDVSSGSKYKILLHSIALTFNGIVSDGGSPIGRDCPFIRTHLFHHAISFPDRFSSGTGFAGGRLS